MVKVVKLRRYHTINAETWVNGTTSAVLYLTKAEVQRFLDAIPLIEGPDALLFDLMYHYGLRREEATLIRREHVSERIWITRVKGGISREYPIFKRTRSLLWTYLSRRVDDDNPYLFPSPQTQGAPISVSWIYERFRRYAAAAHLPENRHHPHVLRHSIAVHLMNAGWDAADVKHWLGHVSIASTLIYARISDQRLDKKFRALRPTEVAAL
jgi:site-specific recombinase XerD